ncbi:MAG: methionine--tRNA ligase [Pseudomonadales bacterium]|nr:methionine--tRNA ligase [Candidatus Woesebacteria bacterium]MCB9801481.1 methionine--tRNA ligase [Pseudomonadales bacterium]
MKPPITYETFQTLDMRVATILTVEAVAGADKLLKITLDVGELGKRVVAAGIKQWYGPEELIGKRVVYLANLEPRVIRGIESQGMLLAAGESEAVLLLPEKPSTAGAVVR